MPRRTLVLSLSLLVISGGQVAAEPKPKQEPAPVAPVAQAATPAAPPQRDLDVVPTAHGELRIRPLGHGSVLFEIAGWAVYVDPVDRVGLEGLPRAAAIFLTHEHGDHLDLKAIERLRDPERTVIIAPPVVAAKLPKDLARLTVMRPGEVTGAKAVLVPEIGPWFAAEAVPAYNLTRGPTAGKRFHEKGSGVGYVLLFGGDRRVYVSGDTECTEEMRALTAIDVAFVSMNLPYTMTPAEAAVCLKAFRPKIVYPYHYRDSNLDELDAALKGEQGIEVRRRRWY